MKKILGIGIFVLALAAGEAKAGGGVFVRFGPPPPPREVIYVRPGPQYVYVPGYYRWTGRKHRWTRGYWAKPPRPHAVYVPGYWAPQRGGYVFVGGYWR
jgi:hypothetical protein